MVERGLLPDVKARQLPTVNLGPQIILQEEAKLDDNSRFASLISKDGHAHLFVIDKEKQIHYIEIAGNKVLDREMLGVADGPGVDAIEHPAGRFLVVAGDKMFIRSKGDKWQEIKGNRCQRFLTVGDDLLCAFIANGEDIGGPKRTDWTVGWFILIPVVLWSNVYADKLVLAQESENGWTIRAVFDPETKLSARSDFVAGSDRHGALHFLYLASGKSSWFIVAFGAGGGGAWGDDASRMELRYARVQYDQLGERVTASDDPGSGPRKPPTTCSSIQGLLLASIPFVKEYEQDKFLKSISSLDRRFTIDGTSGDPEGLIRVLWPSDMAWVQVKVKEGRWVPRYEIVTTNDLPDSGARWIDGDALIKKDLNGNTHVLLVKSKLGFWRSKYEICYFLKTGNDWAAPLILGSNRGIERHRSLAVDETGNVFAVWENRSNSLVGRWILP